MKILAVIPARGGSKGIPKKNIISIAGKPLLAWTIEAANQSKLLERVVVSSDNSQILEVAKKHKAEIIKRPAKYSGDKTPAGAAVLHALEYLKKREGYIPDIIVMLQPTSPLRTAKHIDGAIKLLLGKKAGAVISVTEGDNKHLKSFFMEKGLLKGIVNNEFVFTNRQSLPKIYMPNGAIFAVHTKELTQSKKLFSEKTIGFVMAQESSIDLDTQDDIEIIERYLSK